MIFPIVPSRSCTGVVQQQGHYSTSRKNGDIVYLFTQFDPQVSDASEIDEYIPAVNGARMESSDIFLPEYQNSTSCLVNLFCEHRKTGCDHRSESSCICSGEFLCK